MNCYKTLIQCGNSKALIIPKAWLEQFPNVTEFLLDIQDNEIRVSPVVSSVQTEGEKKQ